MRVWIGRAVGCVLVAAVAGCVGGGRVLPLEDTDMRELYARAYGGEAGPPASGPMDVRIARFCERLAERVRFGSRRARLEGCLAAAAEEGLLTGLVERPGCAGPGCRAGLAVEARLPPPLNPDWSAAAAAGVERTFPRLANPDVLVYVYPHVATPLGVGVPGYLTALPLFERIEYALPGERVSSLPPAEWPAWEADGADGSGRSPLPEAEGAPGAADGPDGPQEE
ncbi:MAG: hypothetical protein OXH75_25410 [Acidobacteria bacterium]|nr:hypothetical protein [Acidobacteriota bacterium]